MSTSQIEAAVLSKYKSSRLPPADFNAASASPRELLLYGIPARPNAQTHPLLAARWDRLLSKPLRWITPVLRVDSSFKRVPTALGVSAGSASTVNSNNWSGALVQRPASVAGAPSSEPFNTVSASWTVPDVSVPDSFKTASGWKDGDYTCLAWIGIDGYNSSDVFQAGTLSRITVTNGAIASKTFYAWNEWYTNGWVVIDNFTVNAGDQIECTICATTQTHGSAHFLNQTSLETVSVGFDAPSGLNLSGNVAEWILEDPATNSGPLFPFPNYTTFTFTDCLAGTTHNEFNLSSAQPVHLQEGLTTLSEGTVQSDSVVQCMHTDIFLGGIPYKQKSLRKQP